VAGGETVPTPGGHEEQRVRGEPGQVRKKN
jgi:hypothetical protein